MLTRISIWAAVLTMPLVAVSAEPSSKDVWKKLATLNRPRPVQNVKVINGREVRIEGITCRLLGIRLRTGESAQRDAARFLTRYVESAGGVFEVGNALQPVEDKDHVPLIWLDRGYYGLPAQEALVAAGLATLDDTGIANLTLYRGNKTQKFELEWKRILRGEEERFKAGEELDAGFEWPSPVPPDAVVLRSVQNRLGKPDETATISGRSYLNYRLSDGRVLSLIVYQGRVADAIVSGRGRLDSPLRSLLEARIGKPQGAFTSSERSYIDYNLDSGKTLTLLVSGDNLLGAIYTKTSDLQNLVGLEVVVEGTFNAEWAKPGEVLETHRCPIRFSSDIGGEIVSALPSGKRLRVRGVLGYHPGDSMPYPWPPVQLPGEYYYFDAKNARFSVMP
jgi:hypothetical protein